MNFVARKRRILVDTGFSEYEMGLYNNDLQMYTTPPETKITLREFEDQALERVKVYRIIEQTSAKGITKLSEEWRKAILDEIKSQGLKTFVKVFTGTGLGKLEADYEGRRKDHITHFICRLTYSRTEELRRWFMTQEMDLFRLRWHYLSSEGRQAFLKSNNLSYTNISEDEMSRLLTLSNGLVDSTKEYYKIPFTEVFDLISRRRIFLHKGFGYITSQDIISVIATQYRSFMSKQLMLCSNLYSRIIEDERLKAILGNLNTVYTGKNYTVGSGNAHEIDIKQLGNIARRAFPPCMLSLYSTLTTQHHLKHFGRLQLVLFLKGIGVKMEDALFLYRSEFTKKMDPDKFDKEHSYNIRHSYGKEGKRTNYTPYACMKIVNLNGGGAGETHGCPFKTFESNQLNKFLTDNISNPEPGEVREIIELAKNKHYQICCTKYFQTKNPGVKLNSIIEHPNQFFELSYSDGNATSNKTGVKQEEKKPVPSS
uniref:DNA primase large subunit n=1 Tax=Cacopsylla melanoneura TaxID=428564 RepID=A0A8D9E500_9HEMI